jgi:hypothetical protein
MNAAVVTFCVHATDIRENLPHKRETKQLWTDRTMAMLLRDAIRRKIFYTTLRRRGVKVHA